MPGGFVYKLTSISSGKSYVGYTTKTPEERFNKHVRKAESLDDNWCRHLNNAINKYGRNDFTIRILYQSDDCSVEYIKKAEMQMIKEHNTLNPNGYNITIGGDGNSAGLMSILSERR